MSQLMNRLVTQLITCLVTRLRYTKANVTTKVTTKAAVTTQIALLWAILCLFTSNTVFAYLGPSLYVGDTPNIGNKHGYVMTRAVVLDENTNEPILVEYNTNGSEAGVVSVGGHSVSELSIMSAAAYFAEQQRLEIYQLQYKETLTKGAYLMSRDAFLSTTFTAADNTTVIPTPSLARQFNSVLVRGQSDRILAEPNQLVLMSFSFDLAHNHNNIDNNSVSLVVNPNGIVLAQSTKHIGYRTVFFGKANEAPTGKSTGDVDNNETVFGPVTGVKVNVDEFAYIGGASATNSEGKYAFSFHMPPCPVGGFEFTTDVWSELYYSNLLPLGSPAISYFLRTPGYDTCYADLVPALLVPSVMSILASRSTPAYQSNLYADVMFLTGVMHMSNTQGFDVPLSETTHTAFTEPAADKLQHFYDFNGDGQADSVVRGHLVMKTNENGVKEAQFEANEAGDLQGLFFEAPKQSETGQQSETNQANQAPDLIRLLDQEVRIESVGILKGISSADLRNTDLLFFRESTGQLIMERNGLKEGEVRVGDVQLDEKKQLVSYRAMLRGPRDWNLNIGGTGNRQASYKDWAVANQLTEPFQHKASDYIREGETIKIVAINRATGYMGTTRVPLTRNFLGDLSVLAPPIALRPPNLKIWAERKYDVESGLSQGETRNYTIGAEGAALTSDKTITIYTQWLDEYGAPLPEELGLDNGEQYGFTGRLAKVVGPNQLKGVGAGNDLSSFAIAPGRKTQVIKVGSNLTTAEHYYIHVIGKAKDQECHGGGSCPSFDTLGTQPPYNSRPNLLVPFLVPLPDEDSTWLAYNAYRGLLADENITDKPNKPLPAYSWAYRPEYQFSQYGLAMQEINAITTDGTDANNTQTSTNILNSDNPTIATGDDLITALYSLIGSNSDRLTPIDGPQELVLALGEDEQRVTIGENQTITFSNLAHIADLSAVDFLAIRLYANNDASNILWEWAFSVVDIDVDSDNNDLNALPERSAAEDEVEFLAGYSGKLLALNHGDVNSNEVPDFAEFDYGDNEHSFIPFIVEIPKGLNVNITRLVFTYSGSDPKKITQKTDDATGLSYYQPEEGTLRVWVKNADQARSNEHYTTKDAIGDYIKPNHAYRLSDFGFKARETRVKTFYIEAISPSSNVGDTVIKVELK